MKNIHIVNKMVAAKYPSLDLKTIEAINKTYWKQVKEALISVSDQPIHIKKIGTIEASNYKVRKLILTYIFKIRNVRASTKYKQETKDKTIEYLKEGIRKLLKKRNQFAIQYKNEREKQKEKNDNRRLLKNTSFSLEKQGEDSGRSDK